MPYIESKTNRRALLMAEDPAESAGELNYQIFFYIKHFYKKDNPLELKSLIEAFVKQFLGDKPSYQRYNDMSGALILCRKEIKRRLDLDISFLLDIINSYDEEIANYETLKCEINGDVE